MGTLSADKIMQELGLPRSRSALPGMQLSNLIQRGLPRRALRRLANHLAPHHDADKWLLGFKQVSRKARPGKRARLSPALGATVARAAGVWSLSKEVFGDEETARRFLFSRHALLRLKRPIDVATQNSFGAEAVGEILERLRHGSAI